MSRHQLKRHGTFKVNDAILIDISLVDQVLQFTGGGVEAELLHDMAELIGGDVT